MHTANPIYYQLYYELFWKDENEEKRGRDWPFQHNVLKIEIQYAWFDF